MHIFENIFANLVEDVCVSAHMGERSRMRKGREHPVERDPTNDDDEDIHLHHIDDDDDHDDDDHHDDYVNTDELNGRGIQRRESHPMKKMKRYFNPLAEKLITRMLLKMSLIHNVPQWASGPYYCLR